jgi:hypothetical protein
MNTVTKKTKVESDGWLKVQAPPEMENQEVDVIIVPQRRPAAERVAHGKVCARRFRRNDFERDHRRRHPEGN